MTNSTNTPVQIPDTAVQALQEIAISKIGLMLTDEHAQLLAAAAFPHLPLGYEVKKLEWVKTHSCNGILSAKTSLGTYFIGSYKTVRLGLKTLTRPFQLLEQAQAAAQADFERRVRECRVARPDVKTLIEEIRNGTRQGFLNEGDQPEASDADLSCPHCGGSGHIDDVATKPVDVAAVRADLDARLKAAGMYTVEEIMAGTPVDKWRVHSGMDNLQFFGEWLERKAREYKVMTAGYDIGDKDKNDDLYEWALAHSGAFHDVLVNFRTAIRALSAEPAKTPTCEHAKTEHLRISQLENALTSILFEDSDKTEQQRMIDRVKARAVLEAAVPAQGEQWQPIETAPKDGTDVLLKRTMGRPEIVGGYFDGEWRSFDQPDKAISDVTHWMPLPAAPTTEAEA